MIDTHCHLQDARFDDDRERVMERARAAGVRTLLLVGCDLNDSARAVDAAQTYGLRASVGIHPHEAKGAPPDLAEAFQPLLRDDRVVAIGEIGLDYHYDHSPRDVQARVLRDQIRLARVNGRPVVFHQREAFADFTEILRDEWRPAMRGVVHCFTGTPEEARTLVEEFGLFLGIGGVLTFPNAEPLRRAVLDVGMSRVVLETDAPYLAPAPMRGKRNEPAFMARTAEALAQLLGVSTASVAAVTDRNAYALFGL